jgi:ribonuclease III
MGDLADQMPTCSPESPGEDVRAACEALLGHAFAERALLDRALTHASAASSRGESNERLEFLGDSVVGLVVGRELMERYPERMEGDLTVLKGSLVSRETLARAGERLGLERFLRLGRGLGEPEDLPATVFGNAVEALAGALFLDGGLEPAARFVLGALAAEFERAGGELEELNAKSLLQERLQAACREMPEYRLLGTDGPDHAKRFRAGVFLDGDCLGTGEGLSRKEAEKHAAREALERLDAGHGARHQEA